MELKDLVGEHLLTGVSFDAIKATDEWAEDAETISFILDGITYTAIQNPSDGYRSSMETLLVSEADVTNKFVPVRVRAVMRPDDEYEWAKQEHDVLDFFDAESGQLVLAVGTRNTDDYYPSWVAEFHPENMAINK